MADPFFKDCLQRIQDAAAFSTDGVLKNDSAGQNLIVNVRNAIEAKALFYVLQHDEVLGREAINALLQFYATLTFDPLKQDGTRDVGRSIVTGAIVYDWCYTLLSAAEKQILIGRMETLATQMEIVWPKLVQGSVTGHGTEAQLSRDMLSCGVATYNEKPEIYNLAAGRIIAEFKPVRNFFYPAFYHHQGSAYGPYRLYWDVWATLIFDKLGYPDIFGANQPQAIYYSLYSRRPDGQLLRSGDDFNELFTPFGKYWNIGGEVEGYAGSYFKNPVLLNEAIKEGQLGKGADYLFDFLFFDHTIPLNRQKASLPLSRYYGEPLGAIIARTGWEDGFSSGAVVAEMKVGVYNFVNHQHLDAGSFQLYYKGPLAVQSGIYQGTTGAYGGEHFKNYSQRTIAHNALLIYDSSQTFRWNNKEIINDGGQPYPNNGTEAKTLEDILQNGYKTGEVLAHYIGPDSVNPEFSYLKGELATAYGQKVKSCKRSFVFLNLHNSTIPAALVVYDQVQAADKNFKKYWLLHCVEEPLIDSNRTTIKRTEKGYNGQLVNTTILPASDNVTIRKMGGAGNEYNVFGQNFPQSPQNKGVSVDSAVWRIEVSPKTASANDVFLNVMQVTDAGTPQSELLQTEKIETDQLTGVKLSNRIVFFSKKGILINGNINLRITGTGEYKVLVTDVQNGNWKLQNTDRKSIAFNLKSSAQLLYFTAKAGNYNLLKNK